MGRRYRPFLPVEIFPRMNILFRATQAFLLILPFQFATSPLPGIDLPLSRPFAIILFLLSAAIGLSRKKYPIPFSREALFLFSFLFFSAMSVLWAENVVWALRRLSFLFSFFPLFPVYHMIIQEIPDGARRLLLPFVLGAAVSAAVGIVEFLAQYAFGVSAVFSFWIRTILPFFLGGSFASSVSEYPSLLANIGGITVLRASAFFPDPHMAAFYFGLALPVAVYFFLNERNAFRKYAFGIFIFIILIADILTFSRGGYVGLVFGATVALSGYIFFIRKTFRGVVKPFGIIGALLLATCFLSPVRERLVSSFSLSEGSNIGRMEMYVQAFSHISRKPYGFGLGNYPIAVKPDAGYREPIYAHSLPLDIATESGILGSIFFFLALLGAFMKCIRISDGMSFAVAVSVSVFFGHSLFEMPLYSVHILPALLLFLVIPSSWDGVRRVGRVSGLKNPS